MLAASVTSHSTPARPAGGFPERCVTVTRCPPCASDLAIASPIPRFPPVTRTDRPDGVCGASLTEHVLRPECCGAYGVVRTGRSVAECGLPAAAGAALPGRPYPPWVRVCARSAPARRPTR